MPHFSITAMEAVHRGIVSATIRRVRGSRETQSKSAFVASVA